MLDINRRLEACQDRSNILSPTASSYCKPSTGLSSEQLAAVLETVGPVSNTQYHIVRLFAGMALSNPITEVFAEGLSGVEKPVVLRQIGNRRYGREYANVIGDIYLFGSDIEGYGLDSDGAIVQERAVKTRIASSLIVLLEWSALRASVWERFKYGATLHRQHWDTAALDRVLGVDNMVDAASDDCWRTWLRHDSLVHWERHDWVCPNTATCEARRSAIKILAARRDTTNRIVAQLESIE